MSTEPEDIRLELKLTNDQVRALVHSTHYFAFTFFSPRALTFVCEQLTKSLIAIAEFDKEITSLVTEKA